MSAPRRRISGRYLVRCEEGASELILRVDVDGPQALGVLSLAPAPDDGRGEWALLARVVDRSREGGVLELHAELCHGLLGDETFARVEHMRVVLTRADARRPAQALVELRGARRLHSRWRGERVSAAFRTVAVHVERERGALALPCFHAQAHPDRPTRLRARSLDLQSAYDEAGVQLDLAPATWCERGEAPWTASELHDWLGRCCRVRRREWRLWLLLARRFERSRMAGLMFDTSEGEGPSRRAVALFTDCDYFHSPEGINARANPPAEVAAARELLFNLVHEVGHAFNLPHPFERRQAPWAAPAWFEPARQEGALTWMNYPNQADPDRHEGASWFYRRFRFCFRRRELLFLRHAPERCVVMGGANWLQEHARTLS